MRQQRDPYSFGDNQDDWVNGNYIVHCIEIQEISLKTDKTKEILHYMNIRQKNDKNN